MVNVFAAKQESCLSMAPLCFGAVEAAIGGIRARYGKSNIGAVLSCDWSLVTDIPVFNVRDWNHHG